MPSGLTEQTRSRNRLTPNNNPFYYNCRRAKVLSFLRAQGRCAWRYFKRTRLRDRARQVAKAILHECSLSKREALTKIVRQKVRKKTKRWFQRNIVHLKNKFKTFFATLRSHKVSERKGDMPNYKKFSKTFKLRANQQIRAATLNVKKESLTNLMKPHEYEILLITGTNIKTSCIENWDGYTVFFQYKR